HPHLANVPGIETKAWMPGPSPGTGMCFATRAAERGCPGRADRIRYRSAKSATEAVMGINVLHHVTVKTDDLEATRDFYSNVLGLEVGFRPDLEFPGYWLYCGDVPVVHLVP